MKEGMRMPGFTAETSLYKPRRHYDLGVSRGADGQVVIPQVNWCAHHYKPEYYGGSTSICYYYCRRDSYCDHGECEQACAHTPPPPPPPGTHPME